MADSLYRRLSCVDCSGAFTQLVTAGAPRKGCFDCRPRVVSAPVARKPKMKACKVCGASFAAIGRAKTCSKLCSDSLRRAHDHRLRRVVCEHIKPQFGNGLERSACFECSPSKAKAEKSPYISRGALGVCAKTDCAAAFVKATKNQRYCGDACRIADGNAKAAAAIPRACPICSKEFKSSRYKLTDYCSALCRSKALRGLFSCLQCGKEVPDTGIGCKLGKFDFS